MQQSDFPRRWVWVLLVLVLSPAAASAQPLEELLTQRWRWRQLRSPHEDGLHEHIDIDEKGRVLSHSPRGLFRYDGTGWERVPGSRQLEALPRPSDLTAFGDDVFVRTARRIFLLESSGELREIPLTPDPAVSTVHVLGDRKVLVFDPRGFGEHDGEKFVRWWPAPEGVKLLFGAQIDAWDRLLVSTDQGVFLIDDEGPTRLELPVSGPKLIYSHLYPVEDGIWLFPFRWSGGFPTLFWNGETLERVSYSIYILDITHVGSQGFVASRRHGGLLVFRDRAWYDVPRLPDVPDQIRAIRTSKSRLFLLGASGELWMCDLASERWSMHVPTEMGEFVTVNALAPSRLGGFWIGTDRGIIRWDGDRFTDAFRNAAGIPLNVITAVFEDARGDLWVGSGSSFSGALRYDGRQWFNEVENTGPYSVHHIEEGPDGELWFLLLGRGGAWTEDGGIVRYDGETWERFTTEHGLPHDRCYDILFSPEGTSYVATSSGVAGGSVPTWRWLEQRPKNARVLFLDSDRTLWVSRGIYNRGIRFLRNGSPCRAPLPGLEEASLASVTAGTGDTVWFCSDQGLFRVRNGLLHEVTSEPGIPARSFWPSHRDENGVLTLGSLGSGLVRFEPDDREPPRVLDLKVLPADEDDLVRATWKGHDPWEKTPEKDIRYRWRLDGGSWSSLTSTAGVDLVDLDAGLYRFEVEAFDYQGNRSAVPALAELRIHPPLWARPAVLLPSGAALLALLGLVVVSVREWRLRRRSFEREQARIAASERYFRGLVERAQIHFASFAADGRLTYLSPSFSRVLDAQTGSIPDLDRLLAAVAPEGREVAESFLQARKDGTPRTLEAEMPLGADDESRTWLYAILSIRDGEDTGKRRIDLVAFDVTKQKQADQERMRLEAQLQQSQKLEALGRLSGGVAHDFNNILTAILGNTAILRALPSTSTSPAREHLQEIERSAQHASELTHQLLGFGRQHLLTPSILDLDEVVQGLLPMFERLLPENIRLEFLPEAELAAVEFDPGRMHQVILNLVLNARDAMPGGGLLSLVTRNREIGPDTPSHRALGPGTYVVLAVRDDGDGIEASVLESIFEPFFTTKEMGRGTGLGLATVHGIVQQSGGQIFVDSEVGRGTTFEVFLPTADRRSIPRRPAEAPRRESRQHEETILICEDNESVRRITTQILKKAGYVTLEASSPAVALELSRQHDAVIHLLVTDVIMPGLNGRELARAMIEARPGLRVLYVSGYTANVIADQDVIDPGVDFLEKPFRAGELLDRVRQILDRETSPASATSATQRDRE